MTRAQADEVLAVGRAEIAAWVQKLTPVAGQNTVVEGSTVTLMKPPAPEIPPAPDPTWTWRLFASITSTLVTDTGETTSTTDYTSAASISRATLAISQTYVWEGTQMFDIPQEEGANTERYFTLDLIARGIEPDETASVTAGFTPKDVQLTLEEYDYSGGSTQETLETHIVTLSGGSASRAFRASETNLFTRLRLGAVNRI
jgi:hypothetical protein